MEKSTTTKNTSAENFEAQLQEIFGEQIDLQIFENDPDVNQECLMDVAEQVLFGDSPDPADTGSEYGIIVTLTDGAEFELTIKKTN
jgi:hypothetical protein